MNDCQAGQKRVCSDACVVTDKGSLASQGSVCLVSVFVWGVTYLSELKSICVWPTGVGIT